MHGPIRDNYLHRRYVLIDSAACVGCGLCVRTCFLGNVLEMDAAGKKAIVAHFYRCAGCFECVARCPSKAIKPVELAKEEPVAAVRRCAELPGSTQAVRRCPEPPGS